MRNAANQSVFRFARSMLLLCCIAPALSCGKGPNSTQSSADIIEVWQPFNTEETKVFREVMRELEQKWEREKGKKISVVVHYVAYDDMMTKLRSAALAGLTPDVAFMDSIKVTDMAFGQALVKLDELEVFKRRYGEIEAAREEFVRASFNAGVVNRQGAVNLYGLPVQTTCVALFWNRAMFRAKAAPLHAAGLDPNRAPRDWDELVAYGKVLTEKERGVYGYGMWSSLWFNFPTFNMYGAEFVRYDEAGRAHPALDSPNGRAALGRIRALARSGVEGGAWRRSALDPDAGFINQKYAMILTGPWNVEGFRNAGLDFDVALVPAPPRREVEALGLQPRLPGLVDEYGPLAWSSTNLGGQTGVILKRSRHPALAFELLDYFTSEAVQRRWAGELGQIPVRKNAWENLDVTKYPFLPKFMRQLALARRAPQIPLYGVLEADVFNPEIDLLLQRPDYSLDTMLANMERAMNEKILRFINEP